MPVRAYDRSRASQLCPRILTEADKPIRARINPQEIEEASMNSRFRWLLLSLLLALPFAANADEPGRHPFYLHALSDLRTARWMLEHRPGDREVTADENVAISEITHAIEEIKRAAIDDGKDIREHVAVDLPLERPGRLHQALDLLRKVHSDVAREEDDPYTRGLRNRAVEHIDNAIRATEHAIGDVRRDHDRDRDRY
jgi:hypothetical protein